MFSEQLDILFDFVLIVYYGWDDGWAHVSTVYLLWQPSTHSSVSGWNPCLAAAFKKTFSRDFINDAIKIIHGLLIKMSHSHSVNLRPVRIGVLAVYSLWISCNICIIHQLLDMSDVEMDVRYSLLWINTLSKVYLVLRLEWLYNCRWMVSVLLSWIYRIMSSSFSPLYMAAVMFCNL